MRLHRAGVLFGCVVLVAACTDSRSITAPIRTPTVSLDEDPCNPLIQYCEDPGGGGPPPHPGIALGISEQYCTVTPVGTPPDYDRDGINDTCEYMLASAFAPMLVHGGEVEAGWNGSPTIPAIPGEYLFAVGKGTAGYAARLAYLPAYYKDNGNLYTGSGSHSGDSEYIMIDLAYDAPSGRWYTVRVFLSSHCGAYDPVLGIIPAAPNCQWYGPDDFQYVDGVRWGAPYVWVADMKHANYRSFSACQGGTAIDRCDFGPRNYRRFPIGPAFEILTVSGTGWEYRTPLRATAPLVNATKTEMFHNTFYRPFTGWQASEWGEAATPYGAVLANFGIIPTGSGGGTPPPCDNYIQVC